MTGLKKIALALLTATALAAPALPAAADDSIFVPLYTYRTGPFAGSGILIAELNAPDFDPMLRARVSNLGFENDDYMEDRHRSILAVPVRAAGKVRLGVTSYAERTTGSYRLEARFFPLANPPQIAPNWGSDG